MYEIRLLLDKVGAFDLRRRFRDAFLGLRGVVDLRLTRLRLVCLVTLPEPTCVLFRFCRFLVRLEEVKSSNMFMADCLARVFNELPMFCPRSASKATLAPISRAFLPTSFNTGAAALFMKGRNDRAIEPNIPPPICRLVPAKTGYEGRL